MKQGNIHIFLLLFVSCFLQISCIKTNYVFGQWENKERDLILQEDKFEIIFHNSTEIKGFKGVITQKKNIITLIFLNYKDQYNQWHTLKDTELENYHEKMKCKIVNNNLETYIINTKKSYKYKKKQTTNILKSESSKTY